MKRRTNRFALKVALYYYFNMDEKKDVSFVYVGPLGDQKVVEGLMGAAS